MSRRLPTLSSNSSASPASLSVASRPAVMSQSASSVALPESASTPTPGISAPQYTDKNKLYQVSIALTRCTRCINLIFFIDRSCCDSRPRTVNFQQRSQSSEPRTQIYPSKMQVIESERVRMEATLTRKPPLSSRSSESGVITSVSSGTSSLLLPHSSMSLLLITTIPRVI